MASLLSQICGVLNAARVCTDLWENNCPLIFYRNDPDPDNLHNHRRGARHTCGDHHNDRDHGGGDGRGHNGHVCRDHPDGRGRRVFSDHHLGQRSGNFLWVRHNVDWKLGYCSSLELHLVVVLKPKQQTFPGMPQSR